jgi:hypothetical protein
MTVLLAGLLATALSTLGTSIEPEANASALHYSVQFDESTGSASLRCQGSSSGSCIFWVGDALSEQHRADGSGTLPVGGTPVIVRMRSDNPGYCVGVDLLAPPKWPDCMHGPLGGALDRSATVDYRWK